MPLLECSELGPLVNEGLIAKVIVEYNLDSKLTRNRFAKWRVLLKAAIWLRKSILGTNITKFGGMVPEHVYHLHTTHPVHLTLFAFITLTHLPTLRQTKL